MAAVLVAAILLLIGSCTRDEKLRYLVISEAVHFELEPGTGALNLPVFAGTMGLEEIVRDVSQAEFYYKKLATVYGPKSFRFLADSTVELLLERSGPLHAPQLVYGFDNQDSQIDLSLVSFEGNTAHYVFRVSEKHSGQVRDHTVDVPMGQSASIGMLFDPVQNRGYLVAVAVQALAISKDLTPAQLAQFLREKNTPRGVTSQSGFRPGDQRWMDDIFGSKGIRLAIASDSVQSTLARSADKSNATDSASTKGEARAPFVAFDTPPAPVGGMAALTEQFCYPPSAKKDSIEGKVILEVTIDLNGTVRSCRVARGVRADLDSAAVNTVRNVTFTPAVMKGKPVMTTVMIPIAFRLH
jgi:TonB family protein